MWMPPSALFPHRQRLAPRGFVLPRFFDVDRHHPAATVALRSTSKNLQDCRQIRMRQRDWRKEPERTFDYRSAVERQGM
jgi:hypothetical protein